MKPFSVIILSLLLIPTILNAANFLEKKYFTTLQMTNIFRKVLLRWICPKPGGRMETQPTGTSDD